MHLRSNITYEYFLSQSVSVLSRFKCSQWWVMYLKTTFNWDIIFQLKRISWKGWVIPNDFVHDFWKKYPRGEYFFAHAPKVSNKTYKNCVPKSPILKAFKLSSCRLMVFIDMNKNMLTEDNNFKTFLKKVYATSMDEFAYKKHSWPLQQIWWIPSNLSIS